MNRKMSAVVEKEYSRHAMNLAELSGVCSAADAASSGYVPANRSSKYYGISCLVQDEGHVYENAKLQESALPVGQMCALLSRCWYLE